MQTILARVLDGQSDDVILGQIHQDVTVDTESLTLSLGLLTTLLSGAPDVKVRQLYHRWDNSVTTTLSFGSLDYGLKSWLFPA